MATRSMNIYPFFIYSGNDDIISFMHKKILVNLKAKFGLACPGSLPNFILFLVLTLLLPFFCMGRFTEETIRGYGNPTEKFGKLMYYPGRIPQPYFIFPFYFFFLALALTLLIRMRGKVKANRLILSLFVLFAVSITLSSILYPKGRQSYTFISHYGNSQTINTLGLSPIMTRVNYLNEFFFYGYICRFFHIIKPLTKDCTPYFRILSALLHLIVISRIVYSLIMERKEYLINIEILLGLRKKIEIYITAYTTNRNIFGFFLFIGFFLSVLAFFRKENFLSILTAVLYTAFTILIQSKTPALLELSLSLIILLIYPIFNFRKKRKWSVFFLSSLCFFLVLVILVLCINKKLVVSIYSLFTNRGTRYSRFGITKLALTRRKISPLFRVFGFGRYPFSALFTQYSLLEQEHPLPTSHNSFADILLEFGIFGAIILLLSFLVAVYYFFKRPFSEDKTASITYFFAIVSRSIYSFSEPRALFLREGTCIFFLFLASLFFVNEAIAKEKRKSALIDSLIPQGRKSRQSRN